MHVAYGGGEINPLKRRTGVRSAHLLRCGRRHVAGQLFGDVIEWLRTPAAKDLSPKARIVLLAVADRVMDPRTRMMRRFKGDDCTLHERLCQVAEASPQALKKICQELADRGLEVRVQVVIDGRPRYDSSGRPLYACRGHAMQFRLPELAAMVALPPVDREAV
jgi:hypothetical protein